MKSSRKGTKLNDIRHFRQARPYIRRRIAKTQLIPDLPGVHGSTISPSKNETASKSRGNFEKRCVSLEREQRSREIAWISYTSESDDSVHKSNTKKLACLHKVPKSLKLNAKPRTEKEVQVKIDLKVEEKNIGAEVSREKSPCELPVEPEVADNPQEILTGGNSVEIILERRRVSPNKNNFNIKDPQEEEFDTEIHQRREIRQERRQGASNLNRSVGKEAREEIYSDFHEKWRQGSSNIKSLDLNKSPEDVKQRLDSRQETSNKNGCDSERSFWLRYSSIRKIVDFLGSLWAPPVEEDAPLVRKTVDSATMSQTKRSSKRKNLPVVKNTRVERPENRVFCGLRGVTNIRDKRLRKALIEHEVRARRLEEENRRYRKMLEEKLKTRQMSSPLH